MVEEAVVRRALLGDDWRALPLILAMLGGTLLMLTLLSWLSVSSSNCCSGVWMWVMFIVLVLSACMGLSGDVWCDGDLLLG